MANKLHEVVQSLKRRTDEGKLKWEVTLEESVYQTAFPEYIVKIGQRHTAYDSGDNDSFDYYVLILNQDGTLIEDVDDVGLLQAGFEEAYQFLKGLHDGARRSALGVDKALDSLLFVLRTPEEKLQLEDDVSF